MFRNLYKESMDFSVAIARINLERHSFRKLLKLYRRIDRNVRMGLHTLIGDREERKRVYNEFSNPPDLKKDFIPEFLGFFLFEDYNDENIKEYLDERGIIYNNNGRDAPPGHFGCMIHDAATYLFKARNNVSMILPEVAVMLRRGTISRENAQAIIEESDPEPESVERSAGILCEKLDYSKEQFDSLVSGLKKSRNF